MLTFNKNLSKYHEREERKDQQPFDSILCWVLSKRVSAVWIFISKKCEFKLEFKEFWKSLEKKEDKTTWKFVEKNGNNNQRVLNKWKIKRLENATKLKLQMIFHQYASG